MSAALIAGLLISATPVAVLTLPRGEVRTDTGQRTSSGTIVHDRSTISTGRDGWVELRFLGGARARLSAESSVTVGARKIAIGAGRVWVEVPARPQSGELVVTLAGVRVVTEPGAAVIFERARLGDSYLTTLRGQAVVDSGQGRSLPLEAGYQIRLRGAGPPRPQKGGAAVGDLTQTEAQKHRGDFTGFEAFVLAWTRSFVIGAPSVRVVSELPSVDPEILGSDAGPFGRLLEESVRPPPFFEEEVPPKGPNVRVEVEFDDD